MFRPPSTTPRLYTDRTRLLPKQPKQPYRRSLPDAYLLLLIVFLLCVTLFAVALSQHYIKVSWLSPEPVLTATSLLIVDSAQHGWISSSSAMCSGSLFGCSVRICQNIKWWRIFLIIESVYFWQHINDFFFNTILSKMNHQPEFFCDT